MGASFIENEKTLDKLYTTHELILDCDKQLSLNLLPQQHDTTSQIIPFYSSVLTIPEQETENSISKVLMSHYVDIYNDLSHGVLLTDLNGYIVNSNDEALQLLNVSREKILLKKHCSILADYHFVREEQQQYCKHMYSGENAVLHVNYSYHNEQRYLKFISKYNKLLNVIITTIYDETAEQQLKFQREAQQNLIQVGEMTAHVAHEIRNPITALKGFVQLLKNNDFKSSAQYLEIMESEINRIEWLTSDILYVSKPLQEPHSLLCYEECLQEVVQLMSVYAMNHGVQLEFYAKKKCCYIAYGNKNRLIQLFINLIKNAIEASNGGRVIVHLSEIDCEMMSITIRDYGVGISEVEQQKMFQTFYTTKKGGTGLGLGLVKKVVENHRMAMHVKSKVNEGTCIKLICYRTSFIDATFDKAF